MGISARIDGKSFWTGKNPVHKLNNQYQLNNNDIQGSEISNFEEPSDLLQPVDRYRINYEQPQSSTIRIDSKEPVLNIKRPEIKGYHIRLDAQTDMHHDFPRLLDDIIVNNGKMMIQADGSFLFESSGYINDTYGIYKICINEDGIVFHHFFHDF